MRSADALLVCIENNPNLIHLETIRNLIEKNKPTICSCLPDDPNSRLNIPEWFKDGFTTDALPKSKTNIFIKVFDKMASLGDGSTGSSGYDAGIEATTRTHVNKLHTAVENNNGCCIFC